MMAGRYLAYQEYKDSGNEWLGALPTHWTATKLGYLSYMQEGPGLRNWQFTDSGIRVICVTNITEKGIDFSKLQKFISNTEYLELYKHFTVQKGDILLSSSGNSWGKVAEYTDSECVILNTSTIRVNELSSRILIKRFLKWFLQSESCREQLGVMMTGACQPNFGPTHLHEICTPKLPTQEQIAISNFLDHETAKIDTLIDKQQQLIKLLKEKRQAVISHAVTKGLNPDAPMKDSGVEWLGEVPEHWVVGRVKNLASLISKGTTPTTIGGEFLVEGVQFLKAENVGKQFYVSENPKFYISAEIDEQLSRSKLQAKDVLVIIAGATTGLCSVLPEHVLPANTNQAVSFIRPQNKVYAEFIAHWLETPFAQSIIWQGAVQAAQPNLSMEDLGNISVSIPPEEEVKKIVSRLNVEQSKFGRLSDLAESKIKLLQERRTALISAAVTGKIDVRNWRAEQTEPCKETSA